NNSELYQVAMASGDIKQLTDRNGPDRSPQVSPDGKKLAWLGYDDNYKSYQLTHLYVMDLNGKGAPKLMTTELDYSVDDVKWSDDSRGLYFSYDNEGKGNIAYQSLSGSRHVLTDAMGGLSYTRPYSGGSFDVSKSGDLVFTMTNPYRPADLMLQTSKIKRKLTSLNEDALAHKELGRVEEIWYESSHDDYKIQGWIAYPPNFDPTKKY